MSYKDIVPYASVFIDTSWRDLLKSTCWCIKSPKSRDELILEIENLFNNSLNSNSVLPCLSVRSALDLFLSVHSFPPGSEVIMSAVNIPSMVDVMHCHGLEVVALDVDIQTMKPKLDLLETLITSKTRFLLVANIYGRGFDVKPYSEIARKHRIILIEDWAEGFSGLDYLGHPESDLSLFSFGPIKYYTACGGAIAKVKDINVYHRMKNLCDMYPMQSHTEYLTKVIKLSLVYVLLNCPRLIKPSVYMTRKLGIDHKEKVIGLLRGFPTDMLKKIRQRPCTALLATLGMRLKEFDRENFLESNVKAEYAVSKLPLGAMAIGMKADMKNHWLFPVIVENPEKVIESLSKLGVDAYCGATQLNIVRTDRPLRLPLHNGGSSQIDFNPLKNCGSKTINSSNYSFDNLSISPQDKQSLNQNAMNSNNIIQDVHVKPTSNHDIMEAEYLVNHVIYLPVNKTVPYNEIDKICKALADTLDSDLVESSSTGNCRVKSPDLLGQLKIKSKL